MKCFVVFFITLGLAMSFPRRDPQERDPVEPENTMTHGKSIYQFILSDCSY